ncbi:hypothetical protein LOTGIDRAFT_160624 [Lottia gigantea]|uniref:E3 ubiquitin-protein ligase RFWD3-like WD40 domain-containing protein n=1 Tax=Lottia gigantea TaxID=225164 RepID=V4APB7_LOTGI|nr:hypothetical protein LOTGIDRAFT_160624 [Lottia gigantea]ESO95471.1 hypothetical protein LOTGIDRAFT_160624 [Lottia gigantea]
MTSDWFKNIQRSTKYAEHRQTSEFASEWINNTGVNNWVFLKKALCRLTASRLSESQSIDDICSCSTLHSLRAGKAQATLSRSTLFHTGDDSNRLIICGAGNNGNDESTATVQTWDGLTGQQLQKLPCGGVPLDMLPININNTKHLAVLLNTQLKIYRWQ